MTVSKSFTQNALLNTYAKWLKAGWGLKRNAFLPGMDKKQTILVYKETFGVDPKEERSDETLIIIGVFDLDDFYNEGEDGYYLVSFFGLQEGQEELGEELTQKDYFYNDEVDTAHAICEELALTNEP